LQINESYLTLSYKVTYN